MNKKLLYAAFLLVVISGCRNNHLNDLEPEKIDLTKEQARNIEEGSLIPRQNLNVAVSAMISPKETFSYYQELLNYLSDKIGYKIDIRQRKTYQEVNDMLKNGHLDLAFICSGAYVRAIKEFPLEILAVPVVNGEPIYYAYVIVHKDSEFNRVRDLQGRAFAFTDPLSNTGHLYMVDLLKRLNTTPESFFDHYIFTYAHDYSMLAVSSKLVDGACVESLIFHYLEEHRPELTADLKIIKRSNGFGIPPVVVPGNLPMDKKEIFRKAFLSMHDDSTGQAVLRKINIQRFETPDLTNYEPIKEMLRRVEQ